MSYAMLDQAVVLVVDESGTVRRIVASILRNELGCQQVIQTESAFDAMELIRGGVIQVDWIFSGWEMPGMTGDQFLEQIRNNPGTANIPFIMMTSHDDRESIVKAIRAGVTDFLIKPFTPAHFLEKIRRLLSLKDRRKSNRYKAKGANHVHIKFLKTGDEYSGNLVDISKTGCLLRTTIFDKGVTSLYDLADLIIVNGKEQIHMNAELLRLENDRNQASPKRFVFAAFQFAESDLENMEKVSRLIDSLRDDITNIV